MFHVKHGLLRLAEPQSVNDGPSLLESEAIEILTKTLDALDHESVQLFGSELLGGPNRCLGDHLELRVKPGVSLRGKLKLGETVDLVNELDCILDAHSGGTLPDDLKRAESVHDVPRFLCSLVLVLVYSVSLVCQVEKPRIILRHKPDRS